MTIALESEIWLEKARSLAPLIEEFRDEGERERQLPRPLFEAMRDAGLFRLWLPRGLGGPEVDVETLSLVVEEISRQDGAAGWNVMIGSQAAAFTAYMPDAGGRALYESSANVVAGSLQPKGQAIPVNGGFRVSGRWPMASGCDHADWLAGACLVMEDGQPRLLPSGTPDVTVCFFPAAEATIIDTWFTAGLRGTGSKDISAEDLLVPGERSMQLFTSLAAHPGSTYGGIILQVFALPVAAVALGIARDAIDSFVRLAATKMPTRQASLLAERDTTRAQVGRAEAKLRSARSFLLDVARQMKQETIDSGQFSLEVSALIPLAAAYAAESSAEVVDMMFKASGSTAIYSNSRIERCFRDVNMVTQHVITNAANFEQGGRFFLDKARLAT